MPGKRKGNLSDVVGVTSMLLVWKDPYSGDAQDKDGHDGRARQWGRSCLGSSSSWGSGRTGTSQSGVKILGFSVGESSNSDGGNSEHEYQLAERNGG